MSEENRLGHSWSHLPFPLINPSRHQKPPAPPLPITHSLTPAPDTQLQPKQELIRCTHGSTQEAVHSSYHTVTSRPSEKLPQPPHHDSREHCGLLRQPDVHIRSLDWTSHAFLAFYKDLCIFILCACFCLHRCKCTTSMQCPVRRGPGVGLLRQFFTGLGFTASLREPLGFPPPASSLLRS